MGRSSGATLDALILDTTGWTPHVAGAFDRSWFDEGRNPIRARLLDGPAVETTIEGWRARGARETEANGGVVLAFDEVEVDGCRAFRGLFKYLAARCIPDWSPKSLAVYIVGMITVPLGARCLIVNTEAVERGTTGLREAMYGMMHAAPLPEDAPIVRLNSMEEFFDRVREAAATVLPSDAEAFDALVETHPLSRVRRRQRWVLEHLRLGLELKALLLAAAN